MSTRSIVNIVSEKLNAKVVLYHHFDGYIEGVGFDLLNRFLNKATGELSLIDFDLVVNTLVKDNEDNYQITAYKHSDIEFEYTIDYDNESLSAKQVDNLGDKPKTLKSYSFKTLKRLYGVGDKAFEPIEKGQIQAIHIMVNKLGWEDKRYRDLLTVLFGVDTCKDLNVAQASQLIEVLQNIE